MLTTQQVAPWKQELLEELVKLLKEHPVVASAELSKVRSSQIQEIRKKLRGKAELRVSKNTIFRKAAAKLAGDKKNVEKFAESLTGANVLMFTEMDPYQLIIFLSKNKVRVPAKGGDIATSDIVVPAGNTGIQPGPIISEFNEAKIQTRIESGSIFITRDTVVARKGEAISVKAASILSKLGVKPMEAGLLLCNAYDDGQVLGRKDLILDLEEIRGNLTLARRSAFGLAVEATISLPETMSVILTKAYRRALAVSLASAFPTKETAKLILQKAYAHMRALASAVEATKPEAAQK